MAVLNALSLIYRVNLLDFFSILFTGFKSIHLAL